MWLSDVVDLKQPISNPNVFDRLFGVKTVADRFMPVIGAGAILLAIAVSASLDDTNDSVVPPTDTRVHEVREKPVDLSCPEGTTEIARQSASDPTPTELTEDVDSRAIVRLFTYVSADPTQELIIFCE